MHWFWLEADAGCTAALEPILDLYLRETRALFFKLLIDLKFSLSVSKKVVAFCEEILTEILRES